MPRRGQQVTDSYGVTGFAARISYEFSVRSVVTFQIRMRSPLLSTSISSQPLHASLKLRSNQSLLHCYPLDSVTHPACMCGHSQSHFSYSTPDLLISFLITPHLIWYPAPLPPRRLPYGTYVQQPIPKPTKNYKPLCFIAISLSSQSRFAPLHEPDFNFRAPTTSLIRAISPAVIYQKSPIDPLAFLLRSFKAVAHSGRATILASSPAYCTHPSCLRTTLTISVTVLSYA